MKRRLLNIGLALSLLAVIVAPVVLAGVGGSRYEYYNTGDNGQYNIYGADWLAQTFTPTVAHNITSVKLLLYRIGSPESITVNITTVDGSGHPTAVSLCSGTTNGTTLPIGTPYEWREITFSTGASLSAHTKYAIIASLPSGNGSNHFHWRDNDVSAAYSSGNLEISYDSGATWVTATYEDLMFEEWGIGTVNPAISSNNATLVSTTSARLNSTLDSQGDSFDNCTVAFGYGTTHTAANFTGYATVTNATGQWTTGQHPYLDVAGLTANTTYYYRARATNSYSSNVSGYEQTFTTLTNVSAPTNLYAGTVSDTWMILNWTKGAGSSNTSVQYRTDTYPSSYSDASNTMAYNGTGAQWQVTGLVAGQTYYFSAWAFNGAGTYNTTAATLLMTTLAVPVASAGPATGKVTLPIPTVPPVATQAADITAFNMEPFTSILAYFNDAPGGLDMPIENVWQSLFTFGMVLSSIIVYVKSRNFFIAFAVVFVLTFLGAGLHLVQGYLWVIEIVVGAGVWAIDKAVQ